ncbi:MAG: class I SAM-dependent rRNA methyltransferase [Phycisphaerae bacterium]
MKHNRRPFGGGPHRRPRPHGKGFLHRPRHKPGGFDKGPPREAPDEGAPPAPAAPRRNVEIPPGVAVVRLRSASFGAFIYQRMIDRVDGRAEDGGMVAVLDKRGEFFGWGFYNSQSQLALRMFSHDAAMPGDAQIGSRIARAVSLRRSLLRLDETTDAYRLVHAEGDGLSGLVADRFGEFVVIELFSLAMYRRVQFIQDAIIDAGLSVESFIVRADKSASEQEGFRTGNLTGIDRKDRTVAITENGVRFNVRLASGHKTGFFCDQRENRLAFAGLCGGRNVLDVCCYTGGFSCYAAVRGAARGVTAVDLDEVSLETAAQNAQLNSANIDFNHADAFDFLRDAASSGRKWDVVVLDPSKFVSRREFMDIGLRKYFDLNRLAAGVIAPGGLLLTCSCSGLVDQPTFVQTVARAMRAAGRTLQVFRVTGAGPDHPFQADVPESAYLKAVWGRLD